MLAPDARAVLLDLLRPPADHRLSAGVATTFTLDFTAALVAPLAFAAFEVRSSTDPVAILEAVRSCSERLDVFCQAGQITVPRQSSDLMAFLEPMVHEVRRPRTGHLFHPKVWLLRFDGPDQATYRLVCLTRNLTADSSWDAALRLDGALTGRAHAGNRPLAEFVRALPGMATTPVAASRVERIEALAKDLRQVEWELPADVNEIAFHVLGIPTISKQFSFDGYRHLVVAPFLNEKGLDVVAPVGSPDVTVVSRPESLDLLSPDTATAVHCSVLNPLAGLADPAEDQPASDGSLPGGLHAKLYVVERNRRAHVFVGSANATDAAFNGNVEILIELTGGATKLGVATFLGPDAAFATLLEDYDAIGGAEPDPREELIIEVENALRTLAEARFMATVDPVGDAYGVELSTTSTLTFPDDLSVTAELLTRPGSAAFLRSGTAADARFDGLPLADVTPFVVLRASLTPPTGEEIVRSTVVRATLLNDPAGRLDEVLARQVDSPEKFMRFLLLLLGLGSGHDLAGLGADGEGSGGWTGMRAGLGGGVFELVVRALADRPEALDHLARLVERLRATHAGRRILPPGFDELWPVLQTARRRLGGDSRKVA